MRQLAKGVLEKYLKHMAYCIILRENQSVCCLYLICVNVITNSMSKAVSNPVKLHT